MPGDPITLIRDIDSVRYSGTLTAISDSSITLDLNMVIRLNEIEAVWRKFPHRKKQGTLVIIAGGILLGITAINNLSHKEPVIDPLFLGISAGISSLGILWRVSSNQKYRIGQKWKLKVLETGYL